MALSLRQNRFVEQYLIDLNATDAAVYAGYSPRTAARQALRLLGSGPIQEAIRRGHEQRSAREGITLERVAKEYARLAFSNMGHLLTWGPEGVEIKDLERLSEEETACVSELTQTITRDRRTTRIKLHGKKGALDALVKLLASGAADAGHGDRAAPNIDVSRLGDEELEVVETRLSQAVVPADAGAR